MVTSLPPSPFPLPSSIVRNLPYPTTISTHNLQLPTHITGWALRKLFFNFKLPPFPTSTTISLNQTSHYFILNTHPQVLPSTFYNSNQNNQYHPISSSIPLEPNSLPPLHPIHLPTLGHLRAKSPKIPGGTQTYKPVLNLPPLT